MREENYKKNEEDQSRTDDDRIELVFEYYNNMSYTKMMGLTLQTHRIDCESVSCGFYKL